MNNIKDLKFDDKNFNDHTEFGMSLLEKSLQDYGAGRSILIDKNNNIIAGNGIVEAAAQAGIENVRIIETQGDELVAVKRTDVDLNTQKGREMAFADNATASVDLSWNKDNIGEFFAPEDIEKFGVKLDWAEKEDNFIDVEENHYLVEIQCENEQQQQDIFEELQQRGLKCKIS